MEIQLQELINKIKKDGVEVAEEEAKAIISTAKAEAEKIISDAKTSANKILLDAKNETDRMVKSSEDAIRQAGRNLLISFRESVARELNAIIGKSVSEVYSSDTLLKLISVAVENWTKTPDAENLTLVLSGEDLNSLEKILLSSLKEKALKGITLKASDTFDGGFRILSDNGEAYYDYSTEAVVEMLSNYLNPKVIKLLKEAE